jgi:hypothetical protein
MGYFSRKKEKFRAVEVVRKAHQRVTAELALGELDFLIATSDPRADKAAEAFCWIAKAQGWPAGRIDGELEQRGYGYKDLSLN